MPGSHDLSVENLRLHERIVDSESQTRHVVKTVTSAPTAKHSARPPAKPETVAQSQAKSKTGSKAGSKRGGSVKASELDKEVLVVTVIEEGDEDNGLPLKAPSVANTASKHTEKKAPSAKAPASHASHRSHDSRHNNWDIYHIPAGIPPPPGFSKIPELATMPLPPMPKTSNFNIQENQQTALVKTPSPPSTNSVTSEAVEKMIAKRYPASSRVSHHSKSSSHHSKKTHITKVIENKGKDVDLRDVVFEEVREVTKRRYVVKMPGDKIKEWRFD